MPVTLAPEQGSTLKKRCWQHVPCAVSTCNFLIYHFLKRTVVKPSYCSPTSATLCSQFCAQVTRMRGASSWRFADALLYQKASGKQQLERKNISPFPARHSPLCLPWGGDTSNCYSLISVSFPSAKPLYIRAFAPHRDVQFYGRIAVPVL